MYRPGTPGTSGDHKCLSGSGSSSEKEYASYDRYGKYFDNHTILIESGFATEAQIVNVLLNCQRSYNRDLEPDKEKLNSEIHVNTVLNRDNLPTGITFVWVSSESFYHILLGRNPDGSDRVETIYDDAVLDFNFDSMSDWSDMVDFTDEHSHVETLPPLVEIPEIRLTDAQVRMGIKMTKDPKFCSTVRLILKPAFVLDLDKGDSNSELFCSRCPDWVTSARLESIFRKYVPKERRADGYPKVTVKDPYKRNGFKIATVKFDPSQRDAQFALHMTKKLTLSCKNKESATLYFTMAKIKKPRPKSHK